MAKPESSIWVGQIYLEELVSIDIIHVNVDHAQHVFDLFEAHLIVLVFVGLV